MFSSLVKFLLPSLLILSLLLKIRAQSITEQKINKCILDKLRCIQDELNRPLIPDDSRNLFLNEIPYHTNVWDEPPYDFYHPFSSESFAGQKNELYVDHIFEEGSNLEINVELNESVLSLIKIKLYNENLLAWSTHKGIFLQKASPALMRTVKVREISGVLSLDYFVLSDVYTGKEEILLVALSDVNYIQKISVFIIDSDLNVPYKSELEVPSRLVKIRAIHVPSAKKYLVIGVRYIDITHGISCTSDVFEVVDEPNVHLVKLQDIPTSGAVDVEPFSINGVTFVAVANSFCAKSDIFMFDVARNGFNLYQRLLLANATDFEYFRIGFRHFLASTSVTEASIYEWTGENLDFLQEFVIPLSPTLPTQEIRRWHNLNLPWKHQALLILVKSPDVIDLIKWSKWQQSFVVVTNKVCVSWLLKTDMTGLRAIQSIHSYDNLFQSQLECIFAEHACVGVNVVPAEQKILYIPEPASEISTVIPSTKPGHNFWMKKYSPGFSCSTFNNHIIKAQIVSYRVNELVYIAVPFRKRITTFILKSHTASVEQASIKSNTLEVLHNYESEVESLKSKLEFYKSIVKPKNIMTETNEQFITREIIFDTSVKATENLTLDKLEFNEVEGEPILVGWDEKFNSLEQKMKILEDRLRNAVLISDDIFMENLHFNEVIVKGSLISESESTVTNINQIPLIHFINSAAIVDQPQTILGTKTFTGKVHYVGHFKVTNLVAGYYFPDDVLTTDTDQVLKGEWKFDHSIKVDNIHATVVNGIDLTRSVTSTFVNHTVIHSAPKVFSERLIVEGDVFVREVNGIDINLLAKIAVSKRGERVITAPKIFTKNVIVTGIVDIGDTLNGFNIQHLDSVVVKINQPSIITAPKIFSNFISMDRNLIVNGFLSHRRFPQDFIVKRSTANIVALKEFLAPVTLEGNVFVDGLVNGIRMKDVMTLHTEQEIPGTKTFTSGINLHNLKLTGRIDGVTIEELQTFAEHGRPILEPVSQLRRLTVNGNLEGIKYLNGILVSDLLKEAIFKDDEDLVLSGVKTFKQSINVTKIIGRLPVVNELDLNTDFVDKRTPGHINVRKIFTQRAIFKKGLRVTGLIDNVNLTEFRSRVVTLGAVQEIKGNKKFVDNIEFNLSLKVDGLVDTVKFPEDILFKENPQFVLAKKLFHKGIHAKVFRTNIMKLENVNGVEWRKFETTRITLSTKQDVYSTITLHEDAKIHGQLKVVGKINNVDVQKLTNDAVLKSKKQIITGLKTITGIVKAEHIVTKGIGKFANIDLRLLNTQIIRVHDNTIEDVTYFHEIKTNEVTVISGKINKIEIERVEEDAVKRNSETIQEVTGVKIFSDVVIVHGNLDVTKINKYHPAKDIFSRSLPQTITALYEFETVTIKTDITFTGKVNGIDIKDFQEKVMTISDDAFFQSITFDQLVISHFLNTTLMNSINIPLLFKQAISRNQPTQIVATKFFSGSVNIGGNVIVRGLVNGIKLPVFIQDLVYTKGDQEITGVKIFTDIVRLSRNLHTNINVDISGSVKGINVNKLFEHVIYSDLPQTIFGQKIFVGPVTVVGDVSVETINNITVPHDVLLINGDQIVHGTTSFEHVIVEGAIKGKRVNHHVLEELFEDTLFISKLKPIIGQKTFHDVTVFKNEVKILGKTCGIDFATNVMTLSSNQIITGHKAFHHFNVIGNAHIGKLNNYHLSLTQNLWTVVEKPTFEASYQFLGKTKLLNVKLEFPTIDVPSIDPLLTDLHNVARNLSSVDHHCFTTHGMRPLEHAPVKLETFEHYDSIAFGGFSKLDIFEVDGSVNLISHETTPCMPALTFTWSNYGSANWRFIKTGELPTGNSVHLNTFQHLGLHYLLIAESSADCGIPSKILRYEKTENAFKTHCSFSKEWFYQSAVISDGSELFIAIARSHAPSSIVKIELVNCNIFYSFDIHNLIVDFTMALEYSRTFIFGKLNEAFWLFKINSINDPERIVDVEARGLRHIVSSSTPYKQIIVIAKELQLCTGLYIIQVFEFIEDKRQVVLVKETQPIKRQIVDLKIIQDQYLAILYKQTGISIMKLHGYETSDKIILPIASVREMNVFTWNNYPFIVLSHTDDDKTIEIFNGIVKGKTVQQYSQCPRG